MVSVHTAVTLTVTPGNAAFLSPIESKNKRNIYCDLRAAVYELSTISYAKAPTRRLLTSSASLACSIVTSASGIGDRDARAYGREAFQHGFERGREYLEAFRKHAS